MNNTNSKSGLYVEVCEATPLTTQEKAVFEPFLERQGLTLDFLDIITNIPNRSRVLKVWSKEKELVGITTVLLTPGVFMKHCFGQGNHIGTNNTFFFADSANKSDVLKAMFRKLLELRPMGGLYIGFVEDDLVGDFKHALDGLSYRVASQVMEAGSICTKNAEAAKTLLANHTNLQRQINRFRNKGGEIFFHEGTVNGKLADSFVKCCKTSYQKNPHPGAPINVEAYGEHVRNFLTHYPSILCVYAKLNGEVVGVQIFIKHKNHLELTEGGFLVDTYHAYENIILASVQYAAEHKLEKVSYGLVLNPTKNRLLDKENRKPIYMITLGACAMQPAAAKAMDPKAQFPQLYWREKTAFPDRLL
jgi:hypothetical protein